MRYSLKMLDDSFVKKHRKTFGIISVCVFIAFMALVGWFIGRPMVRLVSEPDTFRAWIESKGFVGQIIFIGMVAVQVVFAIIPGEPLEIGAGYAFGAIEGTVLCIIGALIGSVTVFAFVRTFGVKLIELFYPVEKINEMKFLKNTKNFELVSFIVFAVPGTPKDLLVYFFGVTKMTWGYFIFINTVGRLPSIVTSTIGGNALGKQNYIFAIITFAVTILLSIAGLLLYRFLSDKHNKKQDR